MPPSAPPSRSSTNECVQVVVRSRPLNSKEKTENRQPIVALDLSAGYITITPPAAGQAAGKVEGKPFTFDAVYGEHTEQKNFYEESCYNLVESVLEGFNGTIFAYGQTGCGKTWTMQGLVRPPELRGVIPRSFDHIFEAIRISITAGCEFLVRCSYLEIYNEDVRDLLSADPDKKLDLKEDPGKGVFVKDLTEIVVEDENMINAVMDKGLEHRSVAATAMNAASSRSHAIFTIKVEVSEKDRASGKEMIRAGKVSGRSRWRGEASAGVDR